jgi:hypothetical protein
MNDANGYEIDLRERGLGLCGHCGYDHEAIHLIGGHDEQSEAECNHCRQLFPSTHDEAVAEALQNEHMEVL